jgi:hypothetical protein
VLESVTLFRFKVRSLVLASVAVPFPLVAIDPVRIKPPSIVMVCPVTKVHGLDRVNGVIVVLVKEPPFAVMRPEPTPVALAIARVPFVKVRP